jgi:hypothetical protein
MKMRSRLGWALLLLALGPLAGCGGGGAPVAADSQAELRRTFDARFKAILEQVSVAAGQRIIRYEAIDDRVLTRKVTIDADYEALGYQTGLMARELNMPPARRSEANHELNERIVAMCRDVDPAFLDKSRGVARAFGLTIDDLDLRDLERNFYVNLFWVLFSYGQFSATGFDSLNTGQCSILSYHTLDGASLVGRNFDYSYNVPRFFVISRLRGAYRTIGNTGWAWNHWIMDGINERGLFIGVATNESPSQYAALGHRPYPDEPAVNAHHMMSIVLDRCGSVEEALALIGRMRIWFSDEFLHFMLADAAGDSAVVEFDAAGRLLAFRSGRRYQVVTNTSLQIGPENVGARCWRYAQAEARLAAAEIRSRDELLTVNRSVSVSSSVKTLWISMADLGRKEMDVRFIEEGYDVAHVFRIE